MSVKKEYHGPMDFRLNDCAVMGLFQYVNDARANSLYPFKGTAPSFYIALRSARNDAKRPLTKHTIYSVRTQTASQPCKSPNAAKIIRATSCSIAQWRFVHFAVLRCARRHSLSQW
jgi:hypothetical protein